MAAGRRLTNEDLAHLIDRNHEDAKQRFTQLESRMEAVETSVADIEQWRSDRDGVIRREIEDYHKSPEYQVVMASIVVPAMKAAARSAFSWKRMVAAMGTLALFLTVLNAAFTACANVSGGMT